MKLVSPIHNLLTLVPILWLALAIPISGSAWAASQDDEADYQDDEDSEESISDRQVTSPKGIRRFHEVLDELLAEFGYDVKKGQLKGLKNLAIRKVDVSAALPSTYKKYTSLLVAERIRENSKTKLIACTACSSKTSTLVEGKLVITSPSTNAAMLKSVADKLGIDNFMDVVLVYHTTHMVLAFQIFDVASNEQVWTRTYNSETIKSRFQKLAVDYKQVEKARPGEDYVPEYKFLLGLGGAGIPNVAGDTSDSTMLTAKIRATEKFNNRRTEFGLLLTVFQKLKSLVNAYPTIGTDSEPEEEVVDEGPLRPKPFDMAFSLYGVYAHNFLGSIESYNEIRHGIHVALGGILSTGYIAGMADLGWDLYFGRRFSTTFSFLYIAPSRILVKQEQIDTAGGVGASATLYFNY